MAMLKLLETIFSVLLSLTLGASTKSFNDTWKYQGRNNTMRYHKRGVAAYDVMLSEREAHTFIRVKRNIADNCCDRGGCKFEERAEYSEDHGWGKVHKEICERDIRENRRCKCYSSKGRRYECSRNRAVLRACGGNPCPRKTLYCGFKRKCVRNDKQCDSNNDCGNWKDEKVKNCRITMKNKLSKIQKETKLRGGSKYFGNVYVLGRPVCDNSWGSNDATVICRMLRPKESKFKGVPWHRSKFGKVGKAFRMNDVKCKGHEKNIGLCDHKTWHNCNANEGAGVTCVYSSTLKLRGREKTEGTVEINEEPVCADGWSINGAQVVCNQLFKGRFKKRASKIAPVFASSTTRRSGATSIRKVVCKGTETHLAECKIDASRICTSRRAALVKCAKCTPQNLLNILALIKPGSTMEKTRKSVEGALKTLKSECRDWDCSIRKANQRYPEYCQVKAFLDEAIVFLRTPDTSVVRLERGMKFNYGRLLNHNFVKMGLTELKSEIFKIGDKVDSFQTKLAEYFADMASYDHRKAGYDLADARGNWEEHKAEITVKANEVAEDLKDIYILAFSFAGAEFIEAGVELGIYFANTANPCKWLVGDGPKSALDVKDAIKKLVKVGAVMARLGRAMDVQFPRLNSLRESIAAKQKKLKPKIRAMMKVIEGKGEFTLAEAEKFLEMYGDFSPSVSNEDIAEYQTIVTTLVETACDALANADTLAGAVVELVASGMGSCKEVLPRIEVLISLYSSSREQQESMVESMAQVARARIAQEKAASLSKILGSNLGEKIKRKITTLDSLIMLQAHKETLVREACNFMTYKNHGEMEEVCAQMLKNPSRDAGNLIGYEYTNDMCQCLGCTLYTKIVPIPAAINDGKASNSDSVTKGSSLFRIPSTQWLVENGWMSKQSANDDKPMFVQSIQLFVPPGLESSEFQYDVNTQFSLKGEALLLGTKYVFPNVVMTTEYSENYAHHACANPLQSLYNIGICPKKYKQVCVTGSYSCNGHIYPPLVGSTWKVSLASPVALTMPSPKGKFFLKAKVQFCKRSMAANSRQAVSNALQTSSACCSNDMYFDQLISSKSAGLNPCRSCPGSSVPRMHGYYCESCSPGTEPSQGSFGCTPCKQGYVKDTAGQSRCVKCPPGKTTYGAGQVKCYDKEK